MATNSGYIVGGNIGVNYAATGGGLSLAFGTSARGIMSVGSQAVADGVAPMIHKIFLTSWLPIR